MTEVNFRSSASRWSEDWTCSLSAYLQRSNMLRSLQNKTPQLDFSYPKDNCQRITLSLPRSRTQLLFLDRWPIMPSRKPGEFDEFNCAQLPNWTKKDLRLGMWRFAAALLHCLHQATQRFVVGSIDVLKEALIHLQAIKEGMEPLIGTAEARVSFRSIRTCNFSLRISVVSCTFETAASNPAQRNPHFAGHGDGFACDLLGFSKVRTTPFNFHDFSILRWCKVIQTMYIHIDTGTIKHLCCLALWAWRSYVLWVHFGTQSLWLRRIISLGPKALDCHFDLASQCKQRMSAELQAYCMEAALGFLLTQQMEQVLVNRS